MEKKEHLQSMFAAIPSLFQVEPLLQILNILKWYVRLCARVGVRDGVRVRFHVCVGGLYCVGVTVAEKGQNISNRSSREASMMRSDTSDSGY